jgi:hypothetical protein
MSFPHSKLCFFRSNQHPNEYFLRLFVESEALEKVDKFNHRNAHINSGYPHFDCEVAAMIEIPDDLKPKREEYALFILDKYGKRTRNDEYLQEWGWYEFEDITNNEKWSDDFYHFQKQQDLQNTSGSGVQIALF